MDQNARVKMIDPHDAPAVKQGPDLLVVGDDPESEIKAAKELGILAFLLDTDNAYPNSKANYTGKSLKDVLSYIE